MRARHRLSKFLLRQGIVYYDGDAWTGKHDAWLPRRRTSAEHPSDPADVRSDYETMLAVRARRDRLAAAISEMVRSPSSPHWFAGWAARDRQLDRVRAGGRDRRLTPVHRQRHRLFVGLGHSSNPQERRGWKISIIEAGNTHVRRLLVESAWHHRSDTGSAKTMHERWDLAPAPAQRWVKFIERRKENRSRTVAIARELVG